MRPSRRPLGLTTAIAVTSAALVSLSVAFAPAASATGVAPSAPTSVTATSVPRTAVGTLTWSDPTVPGDSTLTGFEINGLPSGTPEDVPATQHQYSLSGLVPGTTYQITVKAENSTGGFGPTTESDVYVDTWMPTTAPTMQVFMEGARMIVAWNTPPNLGGATFTNWRVTVNGQVFNEPTSFEGLALTNPGNGPHAIRLQLFGTSDLGTVTPTRYGSFTVGASRPRIGRAVSGTPGGTSTAAIHWRAPATNGGYPITGYKAIAFKLNSRGQIVRIFVSRMLRPGARSYNGSLPRGRYKFQVVAHNAIGYTQLSAFSAVVTAR
ncbi:MAG: hypothetical protein JWQ32_730 [Marmoricola sp.]|nr:hypothetical protein [Marmoricola sp.]